MDLWWTTMKHYWDFGQTKPINHSRKLLVQEGQMNEKSKLWEKPKAEVLNL